MKPCFREKKDVLTKRLRGGGGKLTFLLPKDCLVFPGTKRNGDFCNKFT